MAVRLAWDEARFESQLTTVVRVGRTVSKAACCRALATLRVIMARWEITRCIIRRGLTQAAREPYGGWKRSCLVKDEWFYGN